MVNNNYQTLTKGIAYEYVQSLQQGVSIATAKHRLSFVSYPFDVAFKTGRSDPQTAIPFNPFEGLGLVTESGAGQQMREAITPEECRLILANLPPVQKKPALHWVVRLSAVTGLRINAVTQLLAEDVDKLAGVVCIRVSAKEGNKTELPYWVPIHSVFADDFYEWFLSKQLNKHQSVFNKSTSTISTAFSTLLTRLDIRPDDPTKLKSFHSFRHSTATWLKEVMPVEAHRNAMQGRQEKGSVKAYGSLAGLLSYAGSIINAPLWWEDDYLERLHPPLSSPS
jgi:integrase